MKPPAGVMVLPLDPRQLTTERDRENLLPATLSANLGETRNE